MGAGVLGLLVVALAANAAPADWEDDAPDRQSTRSTPSCTATCRRF